MKMRECDFEFALAEILNNADFDDVYFGGEFDDDEGDAPANYDDVGIGSVSTFSDSGVMTYK